MGKESHAHDWRRPEAVFAQFFTQNIHLTPYATFLEPGESPLGSLRFGSR